MSLKRFKLEKLIRNHLPYIMRSKGIVVQERILEHDEFIAQLKEKLLEEAEEVKRTTNQNELAEELADILEVVFTLSQANGLSMHEIENKRLAKQKEKGGFDGKIYSSYVEIHENNLSIEHYLKRPDLYPLIETTIHKPDCLFCQFASGEKKVQYVDSFSHCYAIKDLYPVSNGHILIIPKEHTENWFTAREEVRLDMIKALHILKSRLDLDYRPHGYNIGANCGEVAGQSVMHLHLHLIPRYHGDMENPRGGVRGVIPSKQNY